MTRALPVVIILAAIVSAAVQFLPVPGTTVTYSQVAITDVPVSTPAVNDLPGAPQVTQVTDDRLIVTHVPLPEQVKMIYMSACVAGTPSFRDRLVTLINETELNSVMIDIKDYSGTISFPVATTSPWYSAWQAAECGARDMREFIAELHAQDIFVIGRITVFQDPLYAPNNPTLAVQRLDQETVWRDHKGLSFVDVAAKPYWDHVVDLAIESYNLGFDELNFDYVRYPSDGDMQDIYFPQSMAGEFGSDKQANLEAFFSFLHDEMQDAKNFTAVTHTNTGRTEAIPWTSADLFGMTTTNFDDLSIGQVQDRAAPYFDFIAPMVYPSHYPDDSFGYGDPNEYPYEIVYNAMKDGVARMRSSTTPVEGFLHELIMEANASGTPEFSGLYLKPVFEADKLRTWIQDFDYGGDYDAADVRAQIQASYDAGVDSWMIWAPSNIYTRAALESSGIVD